VPKQNGWVNIGVGGMAERIKRSRRSIHDHWALLAAKLERGLTRGAHFAPTGYSYYLRGRVDVVHLGNAFIAGDAAGLATRDMAEGIGPAVRSGLAAAESILTGAPYRLENITGASLGGGWASRLFDWAMTRGAGSALAA
jgi:flavin-dependent dehydrogenase